MRRLVVGALAGMAVAGCGSDEGGAGALEWAERPRLLVAQRAPDRVLLGRVRNHGHDKIKIRIEDVTLRDRDGDRIEASVIFNDALSKPLYPQDLDRSIPGFDRQRLGLIVELRPGQAVPLSVGWRQPRGAAAPERIEYRGGFLTVGKPRRVTSAAGAKAPSGPLPQ